MPAEPADPIEPEDRSNPVLDRPRPVLPDAELGGEAPCFAHLFEDDEVEAGDQADQSGRV